MKRAVHGSVGRCARWCQVPRGVPLIQMRDPSGRFGRGSPGVLWTGLEIMANNINKRGNSLNASRRRAVESLATQMEDWAKDNASWSDNTGDAREFLHVSVHHNESQDMSTVSIAHGVGYGLWLELMQDGRFAIILPTIEHFAPLMMATVKEFDSVENALRRTFRGDYMG